MYRYAIIDLIIIGVIISVSLSFAIIKFVYGYPNWWTGLFPLGILPVPIWDFFKDYRLKEKT